MINVFFTNNSLFQSEQTLPLSAKGVDFQGRMIVVLHFTQFSLTWAYGKVGNGSGMETGNGNGNAQLTGAR